MLNLEDQIEQIADAAFAQTSPVEWHDPTERDVSSRSGRRFWPALVAVAASVLVVGLVGGLIALVNSNRGDPISPAISDAASIPPTSSEPIPATTEVSAPSTSLDASPVPPPTTASTVGGAALDACSPLGVCTYGSMNDGRLVRLDSRFKNDELPAATIYGANRATTVFFDESFAPSSAFLLDVGPGDIAYIWSIAPGAESATVSAFELGGTEPGRLARQFEAPVDPSGDTELVPTRLGFVELGCCGVEPTRPPAEAQVVVPWVDRNGAEIVADDRSVFVVTVNERLGIAAEHPDGTTRSWDVSFGDVAPRGMPYLYELDDGQIVAILDGADATSDPLYLAPDGTVEQVASPGSVLHVSPDGRFVIRGPNNTDVSIDPNPIDVSETPDGQAFRVDNPNAPGVQTMSVQQLKAAMDAGETFELIDVRTPEERATAAIAGAVLHNESEADRLQALPRDTKLVFHCHHGGRSQQAAEQFVVLGFSNVHNVAGGINAWSQEIDSTIPRY